MEKIIRKLQSMFGGKPFTYPENHKLGVRVPETGSHCANCKHLGVDHKSCTQPEWIKWNSDNTKLPFRDEEYCCDLWEYGDVKKETKQDILKKFVR